MTSCSPIIYKKSCHLLINSFQKYIDWAPLVVYLEDMTLYNTNNILYRDLNDDPILKIFLKNNDDVIPIYYGGSWKPCNCINPEAGKQKHHKPGCKYHYFNRNASKWFRKPLSVYLASREFSPKYLIWLDADCIICKSFPPELIEKILIKFTLFHLRRKRRYTETGLYGLNFDRKGKNFIYRYLNIYFSKQYLTFPRWDDCSVMDFLIKHFDKKEITDIAQGNAAKGQVIPCSVFREYIQHNKGTHARADILK